MNFYKVLPTVCISSFPSHTTPNPEVGCQCTRAVLCGDSNHEEDFWTRIEQHSFESRTQIDFNQMFQ